MAPPTYPEACHHEPLNQTNECACPSSAPAPLLQPVNSEPTPEPSTISKENDAFYWTWVQQWGKEAADVIWEGRHNPKPEDLTE